MTPTAGNRQYRNGFAALGREIRILLLLEKVINATYRTWPRRKAPVVFSLSLLFCPAASSFSEGFYLDVPYVRQVKNYCGPAALASVLRYWKQPADQHQLAARFNSFPRKGLSGSQLKELAIEHDFVAYSFSGSREVVLEHLRKGRPLIVALSSSRLFNLNHYVVLVGWDEDKKEWVVHDPAAGPYQRLKAKELLNKWAELDNWTLLVLPRTGK